MLCWTSDSSQLRTTLLPVARCELDFTQSRSGDRRSNPARRSETGFARRRSQQRCNETQPAPNPSTPPKADREIGAPIHRSAGLRPALGFGSKPSHSELLRTPWIAPSRHSFSPDFNAAFRWPRKVSGSGWLGIATSTETVHSLSSSELSVAQFGVSPNGTAAQACNECSAGRQTRRARRPRSPAFVVGWPCQWGTFRLLSLNLSR